jgi:NADPH-dependent 2,4-dienoyl-CoA reductase/sulfur reductase-like enzyme/rhodanese-related sulfurtransferase
MRHMPDQHDRELERAVIAAHQIKSPMATVQMILRTVLGGYAGELSDRQKGFLESADRKVGQALETVHALMALAEVTDRGAGGAASDMAAAVREVCDRYYAGAAAKKIELNCGRPTEPAFVHAEPTALTEAVTALFDNAVKYTPEGGRISIELARTEDAVRLSVADSGIGIPEGEMGRLFEPFFRASNARQLIPGGTGLGLAFVRAVARAGGGDVVVRRSGLGGLEAVLLMPPAPRPAESGGQGPQEPSFRVVVIGGVAAGPKVASKVMRLRPDAHVTVVEMGRVLSYAGCGLPYYISGMVRDQNELISTPEGQVRGPEYFESVKNVHVLNRTEAVEIDRAGHRVLVRDLIGGQQKWLSYDKLAIATGALPIVPDVPGVTLRNVFTLHGLEQAEGIKAELAAGGAKDVTIVGGGLIGVEMTESLVSAGCRVTLVEMRPQLLPTLLDWEMAELVRRHFESKGVRVILNTRVTGFEGDGRVERVLTESGSLPADMAIMGVGVRPNVRLAVEAGLELGPSGALKVDAQMRTCDPDIYAAGDCSEVTHLVSGRPIFVPLGSTAAKQARVAAVAMCGGQDAFPGVLGTTVCKIFDYTMARSGLTEARATELGYETVTCLAPAHDRAHFMPDARMIILKLVADAATRRLLGIQAVGPGEAAKRVDVAVAAMTAGLSLEAVADLDLCYAPSYSDAMDNLHTACNVLRNKLDGHMAGITPMEVRRMLAAGERLTLLDVRTHGEFEQARVEGSVHIPLSVLRARLGELPRDRPVVTFSRVSLSAYEAAVILKSHGFADVRVMDGGIIMWPQ